MPYEDSSTLESMVDASSVADETSDHDVDSSSAQSVDESSDSALSYDELCSSSFSETSGTDSSAYLVYADSSCESSSTCDSYSEYLHDIRDSTTLTMYFTFAMLLLLVVAFFARFLNNIIM